MSLPNANGELEAYGVFYMIQKAVYDLIDDYEQEVLSEDVEKKHT